MGDPYRPMQLLVDLAEFAIGLWGQCYDEGVLFPAAGHLVALLEFILQLHAATVAPLVLRNLISVALDSLYVVVEGRSRGAELEGVDSTRVLGLLCLLAQTCASLSSDNGGADPAVPSPIATFWSLVQGGLLYPLFSPRQRLDDMLGTLDLLATSALPGSIGPIMADDDDARDAAARTLINHVSAKLVDRCTSTATATDRLRLRLTALRTLASFIGSEYGAVAVASHDSAIPRIVTLLAASLDELYGMEIPPGQYGDAITNTNADTDADTDTDTDADHALVSRIITNATLLLHALVTSPATAAVADVTAKLAASYGAGERYLVALARLNFVEDDGVLETGIDPEASRCAHELLEMAVTMEVGEVISETFLKWE